MLVGSRVTALYDLSARSLGIDELRTFARSDVASYPWGDDVTDPTMAAISVADFPSPLQRQLGRLMSGRS